MLLTAVPKTDPLPAWVVQVVRVDKLNAVLLEFVPMLSTAIPTMTAVMLQELRSLARQAAALPAVTANSLKLVYNAPLPTQRPLVLSSMVVRCLTNLIAISPLFNV